MGKITCKYMDPPRKTDTCLEFLRDTLVPLIQKYWNEAGQKRYGEPLAINMIPLAQAWLGGSLVVVIVYDDDRPVGFFLGVRFIPMLYSAVVLQSEVFYAPTAEIQYKMFKYVLDIIQFMNVTELWLNTDTPINLPSVSWKKKPDMGLVRYAKE